MEELNETVLEMLDTEQVTIPVEKTLLEQVYEWCKDNNTTLETETLRFYYSLIAK